MKYYFHAEMSFILKLIINLACTINLEIRAYNVPDFSKTGLRILTEINH